ncbi:MAG TPA: LacI family DNA-binding transcriptional regulator [Phototrophicaceae bacterium]|jgi:DNA-binding LacI/PurR family transcriptional regulator|nr:LacI family DNA-binding transcriptional regulator [Phototrophicaceae bacterium]
MDNSDHSRVTIVDIAREVGVSAKTVSRAIRGDDYISPETLERIQEAIVRLGYRPNRAARRLVSNRSGVIGIVVPNINNPFFSEIVRGIEDTALERDYNVLLFSTDMHLERERAAYRYMEENGVDGVIIDLPLIPIPELETILARQKGAILIDHPFVKGAAGVIRIDFYEAASQAVEYMAKWGRRQPGYLSPPGGYTFTERMRGIADAAARLKIVIPPHHFRQCEATFEDSFRAARDLLVQNPTLDSLICFNDVIGIGALEACDDLGIKVPEQVAIIGFDDIDIAGLRRIGLTTFRVPKLEIGIQAMQMLLSYLDGIESPSEIVMQTDFIQRKTTPTF